MRVTLGIDIGSTYTKAVVVDEDHVIRGRAAMRTGFQLAEVARKEAPENPDIADTLGWILYQRGTYERALGLLKEAVAGRPENPEILFHLGLCHHKLGQFAEAGQVLKRAIAIDPKSPLAAQAQTILDELR